MSEKSDTNSTASISSDSDRKRWKREFSGIKLEEWKPNFNFQKN